MRVCLAVCLAVCLLASGPIEAGEAEWILAGAAAADLVTTEIALARVPGAIEGNPLMTDRAVRIAARVAVTGAVIGVHRSLKRKGEDRKAKLLLVAVAAAWTAAAVWNARQIARAPGGAPPARVAGVQFRISW